MSCDDCAAATTQIWGGFRAGCMGCCARALSRCPDFARVRANGRLDRAYGNALQQFGLTHEQVKAAHAADYEAKAPK